MQAKCLSLTLTSNVAMSIVWLCPKCLEAARELWTKFLREGKR
jgi:hypothetical protein